jgi:transcriptional regulator with XRE-family HTH domain
MKRISKTPVCSGKQARKNSYGKAKKKNGNIADSGLIRDVFAGNVKAYRNMMELSQETLAEKTSLSAQTIKDIEGSRRWVSDNTLVKLAKALLVPEFYLFLPNDYGNTGEYRNPAQKRLIELKKKLRVLMETEFEKALETGAFS